MNPEETMPSEINQSQKDKYYVIPFIWVSQSGQIHRGRKGKGGCPAGEGKGQVMTVYWATESKLRRWNASGDGQRRQLYSNVNVLNAKERYTQNG